MKIKRIKISDINVDAKIYVKELKKECIIKNAFIDDRGLMLELEQPSLPTIIIKAEKCYKIMSMN